MADLIFVIILLYIIWRVYKNAKEKRLRAEARKRKFNEALQETDRLIPNVASSDFYKDLIQGIRLGINERQKSDPIDWFCNHEPYFKISGNEVALKTWQTYTSEYASDGESYREYWQFDFREHGYEPLSNVQVYALAKVMTNNHNLEFKILERNAKDYRYYKLNCCEEKKTKNRALQEENPNILVGFTQEFIQSMREGATPRYRNAF